MEAFRKEAGGSCGRNTHHPPSDAGAAQGDLGAPVFPHAENFYIFPMVVRRQTLSL